MHLKCTQCSILLHLIDIGFLTCIFLWQISQIQTCWYVVVGPGLVSTSPAFIRSIARHPAGSHGRLAHTTVNGPTLLGREGLIQFAQGLPDRCDSSTACRLCRLEQFIISLLTPVVPTVFPIFNPLTASATSSSEMRQQGPITSGQLASSSHSFLTFRSFSICFLIW